MNEQNQTTALTPPPVRNDALTAPGFNNVPGFELLQRMATALSKSDLVPNQYRGNVSNCIVALEMSARMGISSLMVMQNLYTVHGRPGWASTFIIAAVNTNGRFTPLRFEWKGKEGSDDWGCRAYATEKATGENLAGTWITWKMANAEGWTKKDGSKWKTMPDQMFCYRAATFWARLHNPDALMGFHAADELEDIGPKAGFEHAKVVVSDKPTFTDDQGGEPTKEAPITAEPVSVMSNTEKLMALIDEASITDAIFEKAARKSKHLTASESLNTIDDAKRGELVKDFYEIIKGLN